MDFTWIEFCKPFSTETGLHTYIHNKLRRFTNTLVTAMGNMIRLHMNFNLEHICYGAICQSLLRSPVNVWHCELSSIRWLYKHAFSEGRRGGKSTTLLRKFRERLALHAFICPILVQACCCRGRRGWKCITLLRKFRECCALRAFIHLILVKASR